MSERAVECECGTLVLVQGARESLLCACARRVVVPSDEEFGGRSVLISAATVERRVRRMIAAGQLPASDECACCGSANAGTVDARLVCEEQSSWLVGGAHLLIIPGVLWVAWESKERIETLGRDNTVPVPVQMCSACAAGLKKPSRPRWGLLFAHAFVAMLALFIFRPSFPVLFGGLAFLLGVFAMISWWHSRWVTRWQRAWKDILSRVIIYNQLLREYRHSTVLLPSWFWAVKPE